MPEPTALIRSTARAPAVNDDEAIRILGKSLYPGARPESIRMVLAWCRATGRDPMKKPIHIVPMKVKDAETGREEYRDVLMPGIGTYRSDAAETGLYAGKTEPEFGPNTTQQFGRDTVTFPLWCRVTVYRMVQSQVRPFPAKELWVENYATGYGGQGVNAMWKKRPYAQLAKVAESQALRMAFPDETGNTISMEEMEGKAFEGTTLDAPPPEEKSRLPSETPTKRNMATQHQLPPPEDEAEHQPAQPFIDRALDSLEGEPNGTKWLALLRIFLLEVATISNIAELRRSKSVVNALAKAPSLIKSDIDQMFAQAETRVAPIWEDRPDHTDSVDQATDHESKLEGEEDQPSESASTAAP